jgi:hypothetical protein
MASFLDPVYKYVDRKFSEVQEEIEDLCHSETFHRLETRALYDSALRKTLDELNDARGVFKRPAGKKGE